MQVDPAMVDGEVEELTPHVCEVDGVVRDLPLSARLRTDRGAENPAQDLVPEADAQEPDVGTVEP
jgi:hypothetical protein